MKHAFKLTLNTYIIAAQTCSRLDWKCDNGECIKSEYMCDGQVHCTDRSDETSRHCSTLACPKIYFRCNYGACVDGNAACNGIQECADNSDESSNNCGNGLSIDNINTINWCKEITQFKCDVGACISMSDVCDGIAHCPDGSDESRDRCEDQFCPKYSFQCGYGACVSGDAKCDRKKDCVDGSDEIPAICGYDNGTIFQTDPQTFIQTTGSCPVPTSPVNGYIVYAADQRILLQKGQYVGDSVEIKFKCLSQYELVPQNSASSFCVDGRWSSTIIPSCESKFQLWI